MSKFNWKNKLFIYELQEILLLRKVFYQKLMFLIKISNIFFMSIASPELGNVISFQNSLFLEISVGGSIIKGQGYRFPMWHTR